MTLRITAENLAHCSPAVRAQLEQHFGGAAPAPADTGLDPAKLREAKRVLAPKCGRPEQEAGALLVEWIDLVVLPNGLRPGEFFYHVANGGGRSKTEAGILKGQGVRAGWPDYCLDLPAAGFHGLRLELKAPDGDKPPEHQLAILARLEAVGFKCCVAWGFEEAKGYVERYLDLLRGAATAPTEAGRPAPAGLPAHG